MAKGTQHERHGSPAYIQTEPQLKVATLISLIRESDTDAKGMPRDTGAGLMDPVL